MSATESNWGYVERSAVAGQLVDAVSAVPAVLLRGAAGVGKTTLANALADRMAADGSRVVRLAASAADSVVPYGGVARLRSSGSTIDPDAAHETLERLLGEDRTHEPLLLVDDVPLLDDRTTALVVDLVAANRAHLLGTARSGQPLPSELDRLLVRGDVESIDVGPLTSDELQTAAASRLGAPLTPDALATLTVLSAGIPLYARELVEASLESGVLRPVEQRWEFVDAPIASRSLADLVAARYSRMAPVERAAFEAIAIAQPLPLTAAGSLATPEVLAALESSGVLRVETVASGRVVRLTHPLYHDVVVDGLGALAVRGAAARAADALCSDGGSLDRWRAACLRLDHDLPLTAGEALDGARQAMAAMDPLLAVRFAERAGDGFDALLLRGTASAARGQVDVAEALLRTAAAQSRDDGERARAISRLANTLVTAGGRFPEAVEALEEGLAAIGDPNWQEFLRADLAYARSWAGSAVEVPPASTDDPATRANECLVGAVVAVMRGELDRTHELVAEGSPLLPAITADMPAAGDLLMLSRFLALAFGGRSAESRDLVTAELERAAGRSDVAAGTWLAVRGMQRLFDGDASGSIDDAERALPRLALADIGGLQPMTLAVRSVAAARLGDLELSEATRWEIAPAWFGEPKVKALCATAAGWCAVERGDERDGARRFAAAARQAISDQHAVFGAFIAYEAVRLGRQRPVLPILRDVADACDGDLVPTLLEHAEALEAGDGGRLLAVAEQLPVVGFTVGGAEAASQAADLFALAGDDDRAARARYVASATLALVPGAPSRVTRASGGLTRREREVAMMAADGMTSRHIAEHLAISVRTVDNHLTAVYRKLAISDRRALPAALTS